MVSSFSYFTMLHQFHKWAFPSFLVKSILFMDNKMHIRWFYQEWWEKGFSWWNQSFFTIKNNSLIFFMVKPPALMPKPRQEVSPKLSTRLLPDRTDRGHHDKAQRRERREQRSGPDAAPPFFPQRSWGEPVGVTNWLLESSCCFFQCFNVVVWFVVGLRVYFVQSCSIVDFHKVS